MNKKISVIVPVYNKENYVEETINSLLNQTYENLEIIIINDGSKDKSKEICEKKEKEDNRIKLINIENHGAGYARNVGIENATGDFISFIDADDYLKNNFYDVLLKLILQENADISECGFKRVSSIQEEIIQPPIINISIYSSNEKILKLYGKDESEYLNTVIMCNKLFKKDLFTDGIRYPIGRIIDDEFIIYKLLNKAKKIVSTNEILYGYIQSEDSVMRQNFKAKRVYDTFDVYDEVYEFFENDQIEGITYLILLRYIKYCVELLIKTNQSDMKEKEDVIKYINEKFQEKWKIIKNKFNDTTEFEKIYDKFNSLKGE